MDLILQRTYPLWNEFQGPARKIAFACMTGMLRSPTAAAKGVLEGWNTRAVGVDTDRALQPLTANIIEWCHVLVFMDSDCFSKAGETFEGNEFYGDLLKKAVVLDIPDNFSYMDPLLDAPLAAAFTLLNNLPKFFYKGPLFSE